MTSTADDASGQRSDAAAFDAADGGSRRGARRGRPLRRCAVGRPAPRASMTARDGDVALADADDLGRDRRARAGRQQRGGSPPPIDLSRRRGCSPKGARFRSDRGGGGPAAPRRGPRLGPRRSRPSRPRAATGPRPYRSRTRSRCRSTTSSRCCSPHDAALAERRARIARRDAECPDTRSSGTRKSVRLHRGRPHSPAVRECGGGIHGHSHRRRESSALGPVEPRRVRRAWLGADATRSTSPASAARSAPRRLELLTAPPCPSGETTLILGGEQLALESTSRSATRSSSTGSSAASRIRRQAWVDRTVGSLRYGSELMNVTSDPTSPAG